MRIRGCAILVMAGVTAASSSCSSGISATGREATGRAKVTRKSYTREFKLEVVKFKETNNLYQTCKFFKLNSKTVLRWVKDREKIKKGKKGSKHIQHQRRADYPEMEEELYKEYKELRKKGLFTSTAIVSCNSYRVLIGLKVKGYWFKTRAKQLHAKIYHDKPFSCSDGWFDAFKQRHKISFRRATNACQKPAENKKDAIQQFHKAIRRVRPDYIMPIYLYLVLAKRI